MKQNVTTTLMKANGQIKICLLILAIVFLVNCGSKNNTIQKHNYFNKDYFYNDSINTSIDFWGDLNFYKSSSKEIKKVEKHLKKHKIVTNELFLSCNSTINNYKMYFFFRSCKTEREL